MTPNHTIIIGLNPKQHFQKWFYEVDDLYKEPETNTMALTTIGADNYTNSRMVLLKKYTWEGFIFFLITRVINDKLFTLIQKVRCEESYYLKVDYSWSRDVQIHFNK